MRDWLNRSYKPSAAQGYFQKYQTLTTTNSFSAYARKWWIFQDHFHQIFFGLNFLKLFKKNFAFYISIKEHHKALCSSLWKPQVMLVVKWFPCNIAYLLVNDVRVVMVLVINGFEGGGTYGSMLKNHSHFQINRNHMKRLT